MEGSGMAVGRLLGKLQYEKNAVRNPMEFILSSPMGNNIAVYLASFLNPPFSSSPQIQSCRRLFLAYEALMQQITFMTLR